MLSPPLKQGDPTIGGSTLLEWVGGSPRARHVASLPPMACWNQGDLQNPKGVAPQLGPV